MYCNDDDDDVVDDVVDDDDDDVDDDDDDNDDIGGLSKGAQATYEPWQPNGEPPINLALCSRSHKSR